MGLQDLLKPAIEYAENGFPVSEIISNAWAGSVRKLSKLPSGQEMLVNGRAPQTSEIMHLPELGETLRAISDGGSRGFYTGIVAEKMSGFVEQQGGWISKNDLATHSSEWVEPISTNYRGMDIWECPPNGQGLNVLLGLNMLEGFQISDMEPQSTDRYHHLIEVTRLALADGFRYITDPSKEHVPVPVLLSKDYARKRAQEIKADRTLQTVLAGQIPRMGNTVYVTVIDKDGNACSLMNSIYRGFGTGLVVPETGILLHCRGALFSLDPNHPNALAPGKRTFHTIIPSMVTQNDHLIMSFGVMGALQQAQAQLQVLTNMIDFNMEPQQALNALRYRTNPGQATAIEEGISSEVHTQLASRGHDLTLVMGERRTLFGKGQIIARNPETGTLTAGTEPRSDGIAIGW
jgi:gamma-glutamyltranspeptidase/glutathione hydrolase